MGLMHTALTISNHRKVTIQRVPTRSPMEGEVLVDTLSAGICGTDLQIMRGGRSDKATILGHEGIAKVLEVGRGVTSFSPGDIVVFNPVEPTNQNNVLGHNTEGIFQQRFLVTRDAVGYGLISPFDSRMPITSGALVEPIGTVIYGQELVSRIHSPESIAVIGAGPIGLLHVLYARIQNCQKIFLVHTSKERLEWAVRRGVVSPEEAILNSPDLKNILLERTNGQEIDAIFLCTTRIAALDALRRSLDFLRDGGCIDLVVGFPDGETIDELPDLDLNAVRRANHCGLAENGVFAQYRAVTGKQVWLTGHRGTSLQHLKLAMKLLFEHHHLFTRIISHAVSLEAAPSIVEWLMASKNRQVQGEEAVKIIIDFRLKGHDIQSLGS
jgi:threonine dehydrogenase-like Zn-dependent dehydrogenase